MISKTLVSNITNITNLKKNPVELSKSEETCVLNNGVPCFYAVTPDRMLELLQAHEALKRVKKSIHSMHDGGLIDWAVMDTLQNSIDNIQEMPF